MYKYFCVPNLAPRDVERLAADLVAYHARFAPLFQRSEQRCSATIRIGVLPHGRM